MWGPPSFCIPVSIVSFRKGGRRDTRSFDLRDDGIQGGQLTDDVSKLSETGDVDTVDLMDDVTGYSLHSRMARRVRDRRR